MRIFTALIISVLLANFSLADVVVDNIGFTSISGTLAASGNTISFTPTQTATYGTLFTIKVQNQTVESISLSTLNLTFEGGIGTKTGLLIGGGSIAINGFGEFQYDLGAIDYIESNPKVITFGIQSKTADTVVGWATAASSGYGGAWGGSASASLPNGMYSVAVPEPGTLMLGSILAAGSGAGFWLKRRRKGVEVA